MSQAGLGFGRVFADHMGVADWSRDAGWHNFQIMPRQALALDPAAGVLHYGQALFEGFKAFVGADGQVRVFRLDDHLERMKKGAPRICLPPIDPEKTREMILALLAQDRAQIPQGPGEALYVRPVLFADEPFLGVRPSERAKLVVITSPVGNYYGNGSKPLQLWVEREQVRAAPGGLGAVKAGANYAASLLAAARAKAVGCDQVLWLDAVEHRWLEEVGTMNLFIELGQTIVTPPLDGTILAGITRDSVLHLLRSWGAQVEERQVSLDEVMDAARANTLGEVFGTGTAAVIAPVGTLRVGEQEVHVPAGPWAPRLLDALTGIHRGTTPDPYGWTTVL